ncbi:MAG: hypothetical protein J6W79_00550 [Alphaproteobacteria bacterium]|nr:hypothetical protein [Alphaproteobacteria bacterium]
MLRFLAFFVVIFCGMTGSSLAADCGIYPNCCSNQYRAYSSTATFGGYCASCSGSYNSWSGYGLAYYYNTDHCGYRAGYGEEYDFTCKGSYSRRQLAGNGGDYFYVCTCKNDQYEYGTNGAGETICKNCPRDESCTQNCEAADAAVRAAHKIDECGWNYSSHRSLFTCIDGFVPTDTGDGYECACEGANKYIYEDANGNTTCRTCPTHLSYGDPGYDPNVTPDDEGVAQCGGGTFTCELGYIRSRDGDNGYKCADCRYEDYAYMFSPYEAEDEQYVELYDYDPLCQGSGCVQDVAIVSNLMENCTARVVYNGVGNDYWGLIIGSERLATSCSLVQVYRKPNTTFDGDYATNSATAYWELVSSEFTGVAPGSYIDGSLCKPCTGDTYSYGGTFVDACFTKPSNASLTTESVTGAVFHIGSGYGTGNAEIHTGFTCNGTGIFKNGNAMCQSCPAASGVNNTTLNVSFDSSKTGIAACYINAGQTFQDEYGTLKIGENKCYANPETSTETIKFCVTSDACAQKLFEAVPTGTVNSVNDLKKKCSSGWFDLPASLNEYISDLTGVGCIQYYTDYGI